MKIIGTGVDIIEIDRIEKAVKKWGHQFLDHILTEEEITYCKKHKFPTQHYAARFAIKEAIFKAFGGKIDLAWKDVTIRNDKDGAPFCIFTKKKIKHKVFISLSHTHKYAVAQAIVTT